MSPRAAFVPRARSTSQVARWSAMDMLFYQKKRGARDSKFRRGIQNKIILHMELGQRTELSAALIVDRNSCAHGELFLFRNICLWIAALYKKAEKEGSRTRGAQQVFDGLLLGSDWASTSTSKYVVSSPGLDNKPQTWGRHAKKT